MRGLCGKVFSQSIPVMLLWATLALLPACGNSTTEVPPLSGSDAGSNTNGLDATVNDGGQTASCGNGLIDPNEICDTAIVPPNFGACPVNCDDQSVCTADTIQNNDCQKTCLNVEITVCAKNQADGCCPTGCDSTSDTDCVSTCGNAQIDEGETCDKAIAAGKPGACPTACDDHNACTNDKLVGSECTKSCSNTIITSCDKTTSDGCCPAGCTDGNDSDCLATCGNGKIDDGETCDTKIAAPAAGSCPTSCDDKIACTLDKFVGSGCTVTCSNSEIKTCSGKTSDGCCPSGCTSLTDADCLDTCGNAKIDAGETCDTKIAAPAAGSCPTSCDDHNTCTNDKFVGSSCTLACSNTEITACSGKTSDGCCPNGCTNLTDADCLASCGNGKIDAGETCDTAIVSPNAGFCPTDCDDKNACTIDRIVGSNCTTSCSHTTISSCSGKTQDGCCPTGCTYLSDGDCPFNLDTSISAHPAAATNQTSATFAFAAVPDVKGMTFLCSLDGAKATACTNPISYAGLSNGKHKLEVAAKDPAQNIDSTPAAWEWLVSETPILWYAFEDNAKNSGTLGSAYDGNAASVTYVPGVLNKAVKFGSGVLNVISQITIPNTRAALTTSPRYTFSLWFSESQLQSNSTLLSFIGDGTGSGGGGFKSYHGALASTSPRLTTCFNGTPLAAACGYFDYPKIGVWHNLIFRYAEAAIGSSTSTANGAPLYVYLDGNLVLIVDNKDKGSIFSANQAKDMLLGTSSVFIVDEFKIFDEVFTPAEQCTKLALGQWVNNQCLPTN